MAGFFVWRGFGRRSAVILGWWWQGIGGYIRTRPEGVGGYFRTAAGGGRRVIQDGGWRRSGYF
ncbi:MAG TPA: hypothetical protein VFE32_15740 [Puia sp.]|nr:hypothetical protein [Puia sp.]